MTNIVTAKFLNGARVTKTQPLTKTDYGQLLDVSSIVGLPGTFECDFCNEGDATSTTQIGTNGQVAIPDAYLLTGKNIVAHIVLHAGENDGRTVYTVIIPVKPRALRTQDTPTPVQQSAIEQAIVALNSAVEQTAADVVSADASAEAAAESAAAVPAVQDNVARLHALFSSVSYGATERVYGGTRILNQITADRIAAQLGYYYDTDEDKLYIYQIFGKTLGGGVASTKFYTLIQSGSGEVTGEEVTYENAAHVTQRGSGVKAIYKFRHNVSSVSTKMPLVLRLCVLYFDADGNEIGRHYSAQYEYTLENGAVVRTRMQTAAQDAGIIEDIGLAKNVDGTSNTFAYISRTDFEFLPVVSTFEGVSWRFVIPDSWYDDAQYGYVLCARDGSHRVYCGPTIYKAQETPPACPSTTDGNYVLKATVADGAVTYTWAAES